MEEKQKKAGLVLLNEGLITEELLKKAEKQHKGTERRLTEILVALGIDAAMIRQTLAERLKLPEVILQGRKVDSDVVELIPESWVRKHGIIPLERVENTLTLGMTNPFHVEMINDIRFKTGLNVKAVVISEAELPAMLETCYGAFSTADTVELNLDDVLRDIGTEEIEVLAQDPQEEEEEFLGNIEPEGPIIRLVDRVIQDAVKARATDIHIEPARGRVHVRYRIDGVLMDILQVPKYVQGPMLSRVKIMGDMDIADKRRPQDGRSKIKVGRKVVDLRISSLPTMYGEKIVLRLLEQKKGVVSLGNIGFSPHIFEALNGLLDHPQGIILVTGPTGSGKTTALYAALSRLNNGTSNIVTVEDPVECQVPGINQVQINVKAGLTFASGLRSILRQDPDVILVGEMRDHETAEIAFHAAQTGHLVLSTLHTNSAAATVTRLLAIGIEPYMIASSVLGVMSQRLVRQLCHRCKVPVSLDEKVARWMPPGAEQKPYQLFGPRGCKECRDTGFWGRFPISEILVPNDTIKNLILKRRPDREIMSVARKNGMKTLFENALERIFQGLTTFEEIIRVVAPPPTPATEEQMKVSLMMVKEAG